MSNIFWSFNPIKKQETNFIDNLKSLGDVYMFQPSYYNICYYDNKNEDLKQYYKPEIDFNLSQISFTFQAKKAFDNLKTKQMEKYDNYVIICTSIGIYYAIELQKLLKDTCKFIIGLEASSIGKNARIRAADQIDKYNKIYKDYDDIKLEDLKKNISKSFDELNDFILSFLLNSVDDSVKQLGVNSLHFQNLVLTSELNEKTNNKNLLKIDTVNFMRSNDPLYKCIWLINQTHQPFWTNSDFIFKFIKDEYNLLFGSC